MVKVIAERGTSYPPTPASDRVFNIYDFAKSFEPLKPTRMYTGAEYRIAVFRVAPGQEQELHLHPDTTHAWFVYEGEGEVTMEDGRKEVVRAGSFCAHPKGTVHGLRNVGKADLVYAALSIGA